MRTRGPPGGAEQADDLPECNLVADGDSDAIKGRVTRVDVVAMLDLDHEAVGAVLAGENDPAGRGGGHRCVARRLKVDAFMQGGLAVERVLAIAVRAADREI